MVAGLLGHFSAVAADPSATSEKPRGKLKNTIAPGGIPLPIGHEAKGLVLPDYSTEGQLQARFEAATAKRISVQEVQLTGLKMTTFTPENTTELMIDMPASILNLETRVITSHERTTVTRADFKISGDTMRFDTVARQGTLVGHVKMVITDKSALMKKTVE
ncbi:MAG: hypothetical protein ACR2ID_04320 [Chthoniobacterales bacterium]